MARLHQIVAIEKSTRAKYDKTFTDLYHTVQKPELFNGLVRTYEPIEDGGERKPSESKKIQFTVAEVVEQAKASIVRMLDLTATKEAANAVAKASVVVGGEVLLADVGVNSLLTLEKRLTDIQTFVSKLPTLDPAETWTLDPAQGVYTTAEAQNGSTRKVQEPVMLAPATDRHPAQVQLVSKDVLAGYWKQRKLSAAIPLPEQKKLLERIDTLLTAVKLAREEANATEVTDRKVGAKVMSYLFG